MEILWSRAGRGGPDALLAEILDKTAKNEPSYWIVPEPYSHATERLLAERGGASVCLYAEVLTFNRLSDRLLAAGGGLASPVLDEGGRLLVMRRAVRAVADRLKKLTASLQKPGFLPGLIQTLDECKCYGVSPNHLEQAGGDKLRDLALIFAAYDMLCEQGSMDPRDRMTLAREKAVRTRFSRGAHLFVSNFASFTPQERFLLKALERDAASFTLLFCGGLTLPGFAPLRDTAGQLSTGGAFRVIDTEEDGRNPALVHMEKFWFDRRPAPYGGGGESVELYSAPGEAAEVRFAAERILSLARNDGLRWRDFAVIASDYEAYAPLIESIFLQYGIPFFSDRMDDMAAKPLPRCIRALSDCARYGFRSGDVMGLLRSGLIPVKAADIDLLEQYLLRYSLRGYRFTGQAEWTRPLSGWHSQPTEKDQTDLETVNRLRRLVSDSLKPLAGGKTARQSADALIQALEALGVPQGLALRQSALAAAGELKLADECAQMWGLLEQSLVQCTGFLGGDPIDFYELCDLCLLVLSGYSVGAIPASLDRVHTGDQGRFARLPVPVVLYIGASADKVPAHPSPAGLLSAEERAALSQAGCELPPSPPARIERELYNLYTACTLPRQKLYLTYPAAPNPKDDNRADVINKLQSMFGIAVVPIPPPAPPTGSVPVSRDNLSPRHIAALYGTELRLSASRIESFSLCPFSYFLRYGLHAQGHPQSGFTPLDVGRELHISLEKSAQYAMERGGFSAVPRDELVYFAEKEIQARLEALLRRGGAATPRLLAQGERLTRAASILAGKLWDEFIHSLFSPLGFEMPVETPSAPLGGLPEGSPSGYKLRGSADRVDGYRQDGTLFLRVVDYKTGRKTFSLPDVFNGIGAQMPLYLFLLLREAPRLFNAPQAAAAGVLYVQTRDLLITPGARHNGLLLNDPAILQAMDDRACRDGGVLPVSFNKDGSVSARSSVVSDDQMKTLQKHIGRLVRDTARSIASGKIAAAPLALRDPLCESCDFRAACHFDESADRLRPYGGWT
jgi:ATP-dependent helicase/nuclease subunit B